jgi:hypothetical protein
MVDLYGGHPAVMPKEAVQTGAAAVAEIPISHAGRARWLAEYTMGIATVSTDVGAPIPSHASVPGHDHSGGQFGVPITRPYWSCAYGYPSAALITSGISNGKAPQATMKTTAVSGAVAYLFSGALKHIWIPGCASDGAHYLGRLILEIYTDVAITVYVSVQGRPIGGGSSYSKALNVGFNDVEVDDWVNLRPGAFNRIPLRVWIQGTVASNTTVSLCSISLNQGSAAP